MPQSNSMTMPSNAFRITRTSGKGMFVMGTLLVVALLTLIQLMLGARAGIVPVFCAAIAVAVVVGARVFRAPGEPVEPPRPWWKATSNTVLSLVLGGIVAWAFTLELLAATYAPSTDLERYVVTRSLMVLTAALGAFYINSGVRQAAADELGRRRIADPTRASLLRPPFRLTTVGGKLVYVYLYSLVGFAVGPLTNWAIWPLGMVVDLALILLGIRLFRGRTEAIDPPRAWWRASGRPTASFALAGLAAAVNVFNLIAVVGGDREVFVTPVEGVANVIYVILLMAIYLNSAIRLIRLGTVSGREERE